MRALLFLSVTVALCLLTCCATDLILGTPFNSRLVWQQKVESRAILLIRREKNVFYSDTEQRIIRGIIARDLDNSKASVSITAGGIGFTYCNILLKSVRGDGLYYNIEIYA